MLSIIFLILVVLVCGTAGLVVGRDIRNRSVYGVKHKELKVMSWPSQQILKAYNKLPVDHRPYANIVYMLEALDTKFEVKKVNKHFTRSGWEHSWMSWDCEYCDDKSPICVDYHAIVFAIADIQDALKERERAIQIAGRQDGLNAIAELTESLRREHELIKDVTKELVS